MRLVILALGWSLGLVLAAGLPIPSLAWGALLAAGAGAAALLWRQARWPALALVALALGGLRFTLAPSTDSLSAWNDRGGLTLEGVINEPPSLTDSALQIRLDVDTVERGGSRQPVTGRALVRAPVTAEVRVGERIRATGLLVAPRMIGDLDYGAYLARSGIHSLLRDASIEVLAPASPAPASVLDRLRSALGDAILSRVPPPQSGLLIAILLGDESGIAPSTEAAFAVTGTAHLVAISGFNMMVVSAAAQGILLRLGVSRRGAAIGAIAIIAAYTLLVGATPAVVRATLMSGLLVFGQSLGRRTFIAASLAFAVLVITALNPLALWDIGFQLSLSAAFGIAMLSGPLMRATDRGAERLLPSPLNSATTRFVSPAFSASLAAQLAVLPLIALTFGRISLVSPLVNLLVAPAQPALLLTGAAGSLLGLQPLMPALILAPAYLLLSYTLAVITSFARLPGAEITYYPAAWVVGFFYIALIGGGLLMVARPPWFVRLGQSVRSRPVVIAVLLAAVGVGVLTGARLAEWPDRNLHVWFLDQDGDHAVLIRTPGGAQALIDGGSHPARLLTDIGARLPFDDRTLEIWVLTQPSLNRVQSAGRLLDQYSIGRVLFNGQPTLDTGLAEVLGRTAGVTPILAGQQVIFSDGTALEVLHPSAEPEATAPLRDGGLVLRLTYGELSVLLLGDASASAQVALVEAGYGRSATVLQAPAGGAEGSLAPEIVSAAQPQVAVLLTRREDPNEPAPDTLTLLDDAQVLQTGTGGSLHLWSDGHRLWTEQTS